MKMNYTENPEELRSSISYYMNTMTSISEESDVSLSYLSRFMNNLEVGEATIYKLNKWLHKKEGEKDAK